LPRSETGVDPNDAATKKSTGVFQKDYTKFLRPARSKGARIGIARDFMGKDAGTDAVIEEAIATLKKLGAIVVDPVKYPEFLLQSKQPLSSLIMSSEFKAQITDYLKAKTKPASRKPRRSRPPRERSEDWLSQPRKSLMA